MIPSNYEKRTVRRIISVISGFILGILLALEVPITFIPKDFVAWGYLHFLSWIFIGIMITLYVEQRNYLKKLQKPERGTIEDEMVVEIIKVSYKEMGIGILSFDGDTLSFRGFKRGTLGLKDDEIFLNIKLKDILNFTAQIKKDKVLRSKVERGGTMAITTKDGSEYRFSNETIYYHNYEISKWLEYLSHPEILKKKVDLNRVDKCRYCNTLLEKNNTYCPNCFRHRCPMCDEWLGQKESICPYCEYD